MPSNSAQRVADSTAMRLSKGWRWLMEGLAIIAPDRFKAFGWRPTAELLPNDASSPQGRRVIERSLLGATRLTPYDSAHGSLPGYYALPASDVFESQVELPAAAGPDVREAISHRLDALSPLPPDHVEFAVSAPTRRSAGRLETSLAIVRKASIADALQSAQGRIIDAVGAFPDDLGRFRYVFWRRANASSVKRILGRIAALALGGFVFVSGVGSFLDKRIAFENARTQLFLLSIRDEREPLRLFEEAARQSTLAPSVSVEESISQLLTSLPSDVWITEVTMKGDGNVTTGFAPRNSEWKGADVQLSESPRPNVSTFVLSIDPKRSK